MSPVSTLLVNQLLNLGDLAFITFFLRTQKKMTEIELSSISPFIFMGVIFLLLDDKTAEQKCKKKLHFSSFYIAVVVCFVIYCASTCFCSPFSDSAQFFIKWKFSSYVLRVTFAVSLARVACTRHIYMVLFIQPFFFLYMGPKGKRGKKH